jgi:putative ABC transport system permease protein
MFTRWMLTAWRIFIKYRSFSIINVIGLSLGMACLTAIFLYVSDELSYDRFQQKADRIYRVNSITNFNGNQNRYSTSSTPLAEAIRNDIPDAEQTARLFGRQATLQILSEDSTKVNGRKYKEDHFYLADPELLKIFTFDFLKGNAETALTNPNQLVITRKIAIKYFTSIEQAIGKLIQLEGTIPLVVSAVIEDLPDQSHQPIEIIAHFENYFNLELPGIREYLKRDWLYSPVYTYLLLKPTSSPHEVEKKIIALNATYADERVKENVSYELQPLLKIHLYSNYTFESNQGNIRFVYFFSLIGFLIILIACINFINLSTVHSLKRSREIGMRKVLGAERNSLALQFLSESLCYVILSFLIALLILYLALPTINELVDKKLMLSMLLAPHAILGMVMIIICTGLTAGLYPALFITKFNPIIALKGLKNTSSNKGLLVRRILVVTQFASSIALIIFSIIITQQIKFMTEKPLGFQKDFILTLPMFSENANSILGGGVDGALRGRMNEFENQLVQNSAIEAVTVSASLPGRGTVSALVKTDSLTEDDNVFVPVIAVDYDFLTTYKIDLLAGRDFSREAGTDHLQAFIANEEAIKQLGWENPQDAVGQHIEVMDKNATIIGVIKNYHFEGLQQPLRPLLLEVNVGKFTVFSLRINSKNVPATIETVRSLWNETFPERVFEFEFLDDQLKANYLTDQKFGGLVNYFSIIAILISALGIIGLSAYVNHQKQKEASIRKVMGASATQIFQALSKEFTRIFILAVIVAIPTGFFLSYSWLNDFAFHVTIGWIPFAFASLCAGIVILITTAYQTIKTALVNPVNALKEE